MTQTEIEVDPQALTLFSFASDPGRAPLPCVAVSMGRNYLALVDGLDAPHAPIME